MATIRPTDGKQGRVNQGSHITGVENGNDEKFSQEHLCLLLMLMGDPQDGLKFNALRWISDHSEVTYPLARFSPGLVATCFELHTESIAVRHDDVTAIQIADHQAVLSLSQMQGDQ